MNRAILVVAFGTTVERARTENIDPVVEKIRQAHSESDVYLAFTSRIITKKLRERGEFIHTEEGMMEELIAKGYEEIIVQPLHFTGGEEYEKLVANIRRFEGQGACKQIRIGRPLLFFMGQEGEYPDDYERLIDDVLLTVPVEKGEGLVFIGHGGVSIGNACYSVLQLKLELRGFKHVRIASLECFPTVEDTVLPWTWTDETPKTLHLHPLLLVCGDHALNDIFGEEDSLTVEFEEQGFKVVQHQHGLGEYDVVQNIYLEHLQDAIDGKYIKGHKHIPKIK